MMMELAARSLPSLLPNLPLQVQLILLTSQLAVKNPMTVIVNMGFGVAVIVVVSVSKDGILELMELAANSLPSLLAAALSA